VPCDVGVFAQSSHAVLVPATPVWDVDAGQVTLGCEPSADVAADSEKHLEFISRALALA
jgi:hypothetical protein